MSPAIQFVGKDHVLQLFGVPMLGVTPGNGKKLLLSMLFILLTAAGGQPAASCNGSTALGRRTGRGHFWIKQAIRLATAVFLITGTL